MLSTKIELLNYNLNSEVELYETKNIEKTFIVILKSNSLAS